MQELNTFQEVDWLTLNPMKAQSKEQLFHGIILSFESYCKILHPIFIDDSIKDQSITWNDVKKDSAVEQKSQIDKLLPQENLIRGWSENATKGHRILWKELAVQCGIQFDARITDESFTKTFPTRSWPRYLLGPQEGSIDIKTVQALIQNLSVFTVNKDCYFYYMPLTAADCNQHLFKGKLNEIHHLFSDKCIGGAPTYWWGEDRAWCVNTSYDSTFTVVSGSRLLVDQVLNNACLECIQITKV